MSSLLCLRASVSHSIIDMVLVVIRQILSLYLCQQCDRDALFGPESYSLTTEEASHSRPVNCSLFQVNYFLGHIGRPTVIMAKLHTAL